MKISIPFLYTITAISNFKNIKENILLRSEVGVNIKKINNSELKLAVSDVSNINNNVYLFNNHLYKALTYNNENKKIKITPSDFIKILQKDIKENKYVSDTKILKHFYSLAEHSERLLKPKTNKKEIIRIYKHILEDEEYKIKKQIVAASKHLIYSDEIFYKRVNEPRYKIVGPTKIEEEDFIKVALTFNEKSTILRKNEFNLFEYKKAIEEAKQKSIKERKRLYTCDELEINLKEIIKLNRRWGDVHFCF